tara:strand:- start:19 stop:126 length:108 start_codon:yes stop_codon:yes gene_type:complete
MPFENNQRDKEDGAFVALKWVVVAIIAIIVREVLQ